ELYAPLWRFYLEHPASQVADLAGVAAFFLENQLHAPQLAWLERNFRIGDAVRPDTFTGQAQLNDRTHEQVKGFFAGAARLAAASRVNLAGSPHRRAALWPASESARDSCSRSQARTRRSQRPVCDAATSATCSGVPAAITRPPASPPSGPRSTTQSAHLT